MGGVIQPASIIYAETILWDRAPLNLAPRERSHKQIQK